MGRRVQRTALTNNSGWQRALSSSGAGSGGKSEEDIYTTLFGENDEDEDTASGYVESGVDEPAQQTRRPTREQRRKAEESKPKLQISDIPQPLWSDSLEISDERWSTKMEFDDIPDWSPDFVSRVSKERVQLLPEGIPTLSELSKLALPPQPFPHPGHGETKQYAKLRRQAHYEHVSSEVDKLAEPRIAKILGRTTWQEKQDAVDELFEAVEFQLRDSEPILSGHPQFGSWVERALESYLKAIKGGTEEEIPSEASTSEETAVSEATDAYPSVEEDEAAMPIFMDCYSSDDPEDQMVPTILNPLKQHPHDGPGRMVEEWELSAHSTSKRILLRQPTRKIARALLESPTARVVVTGRRGVGKTAAIAATVAAARKSGQIVLYLPDGNRLHRHGFYVEPSAKLDGIFDLPMLSQEVCKEFLLSHDSDLEGMEASEELIKEHFTDRQLEDFTEYSEGNISLVDLLKAAETHLSCAAVCYSVVIHCLKNQEEKPFLMVLDEFNCYFEPGRYFHMDYDDEVKTSIPYDQISLFKPALDAMALSIEDDEELPLASPVPSKNGGVVVGLSESCAVSRRVTDALVAHAHRCAAAGSTDAPLVVCDVGRFSELEVDHILSNLESIGLGNLRNDRGETVMNKEGVAYLRMVSSSVGQELVDVCCY